MPRTMPRRRAHRPLKLRRGQPIAKSVVGLVLQRDDGCCVRCGVELTGTRGYDWSIHHRRPKAMGGTLLRDTNMPQNLISVCGADNAHRCHGAIHRTRSESMPRGWLLSNMRPDDPLLRPILVAHGSRWVYLTEDGRYEDSPPAVAS